MVDAGNLQAAEVLRLVFHVANHVGFWQKRSQMVLGPLGIHSICEFPETRCPNLDPKYYGKKDPPNLEKQPEL